MKKIIIDTDIGDDIDDAYAIAFAVKLKKFELQGITTVYRNSLQRAKIASALLSVLGVGEKQVCVGEDYPPNCKFAIESFEEVLPDGRPVIPHYRDEFASAPVSSKRAAEFIAEQAEKYPGEITVIAIGPMTNLAEVAEKYQRSYKKLAKIVCMGGMFFGKKAEWNIRCDPESAAAVLGGGVPVTFVGLDVTAYTYLTSEDVAQITAFGGAETKMLAGMLEKWVQTHPGRMPTMHDALTVAEAADCGFCRYEEKKIRIPLVGEKRAYTEESEEGVDVRVAVSVDREKFLGCFKQTLEQN